MLEREAFGNATVVAKLQAFHWVWIDRDHTPAVPKRLNVSAYPSLLVLGQNDENVHRWSGFLAVDKFLPQVDEALQRYELFRAGKTFDTPTPRAPVITTDADVRTFAAPSEEIANGITSCGGALLAAFGNRLHWLDADGKSERSAALPADVRDLASDGKRLFALSYGWTAGRPFHELDPKTGAVLRSVVTEANAKQRHMGAFGLAWHDGALWVLESTGKLHRVDPETGAIAKTFDIGKRYVGGLDFDGEHFVVGSRDALHFVAPSTGTVVRSLPLAYPVRAVACRDGKILLLEQPIFGFGRKHESVRVWPARSVVHELTLRAAK